MHALSATNGTPDVPAPASGASRSFSSILARRKRLLAAIVIGVLILTIVGTLFTPKTYTTHVTFIAGGATNAGASGQTDLPVLNAILDISNAQSSETYAEMLRQPKTVELAMRTLGIDITPQAMLHNIRVKPIPNTSILDASVTWSNAVDSARIANALAGGYVALRRSLISQQASAAAASIESERRTASVRLRASADRLARYQSANGIADLEAQTNAVVASLSALDVRLGTTGVDLRQANAQLTVVRREIAQTPETTTGGTQVAPNPVVSQLRSQLATVEVALQTARRQYTESHPVVKALLAQRNEVRRALAGAPTTIVASDNTVANPLRSSLLQQAATLASTVASDTAQIAELDNQRMAMQPRLKGLPAQAAALAQLKREAKVDQDMFDALQRKYDEAKIAESTTLSDVAIVSAADAHAAQVRPRLSINLAIGFVLAFFLGVTGVVLAERFDRRIVSEEDLTERLHLPVLSSIPMLPLATGVPAWMRAVRIDAVLQLVTSLRYASTERIKTIAFTSADPRDGKSLVAVETAVAMAELGPRVLLVDADLRMPSIHRKLNVTLAPGLSDVLVGTCGLEGAIRSTQQEGLDVITAGTPVPNAFVLLQSAAFDNFLAQVSVRYTSIVIDTPACGAVVDAAVVCARADGTVYVVAANDTDAHSAARGLARLRAGGVRRIIGAVFNRSTPRRSTIGPYGELIGGVRSFPLLPSGRNE